MVWLRRVPKTDALSTELRVRVATSIIDDSGYKKQHVPLDDGFYLLRAWPRFAGNLCARWPGTKGGVTDANRHGNAAIA